MRTESRTTAAASAVGTSGPTADSSAASTPSAAVALVRLGAALVGLATLFSWWASPDRLASLPWSVIALVGVAVVIATSGRRRAAIAGRLRVGHLVWFYLVSGVAALLSALLTSRWPTNKMIWLAGLYSAIPSIRSFPWAAQGLQPNQTGGFLAVCTAFAAVFAAWPSSPRRLRAVALALALFGPVVVLMTGSRAALAGLVVVYVAILIVRTRHLLWAWACGVLVAGIGVFTAGQLPRLVSFFLQDEGLDTKLASRVDIWSSALRGIQDHAFTGIGLGVFNQVIPARYPYHVVGLSFPVSQAHNLWLDVTLAIGIPGVIGFALLLAGSVILAVRAIGRGGPTSVLALGLMASLGVYLVFGLTDSISLSVPTSFVVWLWSASLVILHEMRCRPTPAFQS